MSRGPGGGGFGPGEVVPRVLVASWPDWPVVAAGCPPEVAAVVVSANRVTAVTAAARAEGVRVGLRRREAQGRCPGLLVVPADPARDAREWEPAVAAVEAMAPAVEVWGAGVLALATRGPSRYFGGDAALAGRVQAAVGVGGTVGVGRCRVGVADSRFAAALAATGSGEDGNGVLVVDPGASPAWLAPQPVSALGPGYTELADLLVRLGIRTLGALAALPEPAVLGRFGTEGLTAQRLARGLDDRPLHARTPPPDLACSVEMDPPEMRIEAAAFVAKGLADQLLTRLGQAGLAATLVAIEVETEHGETLVRRWRHDGALTASALAERTRWQLDGWLAGAGAGGGGGRPTGGLTLLRLIPEEVRPDTGRQLDFWGGQTDADTRVHRALARVQGLLGPEAVVTAVIEGGRGFAEQARLVPWGDARDEPPRLRTASTGRFGRCVGGRSNGRARGLVPDAGRPAPWPGRLPGPSPVEVYLPARPAALLDGEGQPVAVSGRGLVSSVPAWLSVEGEPEEAVALWAGPWPVEERWWEPGGRRWARFQVMVESGVAFLLCLESGQWWIEAIYA